jgi:tetratricopeptide (TPR) repeat protein
MHNLESIWKEYDAFENNLNKVLAKALIAEYGGKYMSARAVYRERKSYMEGIIFGLLPSPPTYSKQEGQQVHLWRRLINYEKSNPLRANPPLVKKRVTFTYNQALLCLYFHPDLWFEAATYQQEVSGPEEAEPIFLRAIEALPQSLFLHFAYADFLENQKKFKEARDIYERLLQNNSHPLAWIQLMRFSRRSEGVEQARKVFMRARKSPACTYHVYIASAMMEFYVNKNAEVARNIFELGMKTFNTSPPFVLHYLEFLIHLNQENNVRVLFERIVNETKDKQIPEVWQSFLQYEALCADLPSILKLEKRRATMFPDTEVGNMYSMVQRYRFLDLLPCQLSLAYLPTSLGGDKELGLDSVKKSFPRPDLSKMVPLHIEPSPAAEPLAEDGRTLVNEEKDEDRPSTSYLDDGVSERPPPSASENAIQALANFLRLLPPPETYQGLCIGPDLLIGLLHETADAQDVATKKRKAEEPESDATTTPARTQNAPPTHDVFRQRQAAKLSRFK